MVCAATEPFPSVPLATQAYKNERISEDGLDMSGRENYPI